MSNQDRLARAHARDHITAGPQKYTDLGLEKSTFKRWADFHVFSALKCYTDITKLPDKEN